MTRAVTFGDNRLSDRFWKFVRRGPAPNDCWTWTGALRRGYGTYWQDRRNTGAHVWAYRQLIGPIPAGLQLDHVCHDGETCRLAEACPHRACVNPDHLQVATARSNTLRSGNPAARHARKTHCTNGHEFTDENTYWRPTGGRACRSCAHERELRYKPRAVKRPDFYTHCAKGHPWADGNHYLDTNGWRQCRKCQRLATQRYREGRKQTA